MTDNAPPLPPNDFGFSDIWFSALKTFGMLFVVLAILIGVLYLVKKLMDKRGAAESRGAIVALSTFYVSPKEKLMLIDVLGEKMLIGITSQSITFLSKIESDVEMIEGFQKEKVSSDPFESVMKKVFSKHRNEQKKE